MRISDHLAKKCNNNIMGRNVILPTGAWNSKKNTKHVVVERVLKLP